MENIHKPSDAYPDESETQSENDFDDQREKQWHGCPEFSTVETDEKADNCSDEIP